MDAYLVPEGCELFCEDCAPEGAEAYPDGGGESDAPEHCAACGCPLENPLTDAGVMYVLNAMRETLREPREQRNRTMPLLGSGEETMTYWHGSRHVEIVRGWVESVGFLMGRDARFAEKFLSRTEK